MRKLASVQTIDAIEPIAGKDRIVLASILGWRVIVGKDDFKVGDKCVYCEIDSVMPARPEFEFLASKKYRIKTMRLGGVISQGIAFPMSVLPNGEYDVGTDVTELLGVTKYEPPEIEDASMYSSNKHKKSWFYKFMMRFNWFRQMQRVRINAITAFPSDYVSKTDETRIQEAPWLLQHEGPWVVTEKVDGTSGTFLLVKQGKKYEYFVCSRNRRLPEKDNSIYWKVSEKYDIENILKKIITNYAVDWACIQGECIGPAIQGNKYKKTEPELHVFNVLTSKRRYNSIEAEYMMRSNNIPFVPIVEVTEELPSTADEVITMAHGKSKLADTSREGLVIRDINNTTSFKAVDPLFLLKWNE